MKLPGKGLSWKEFAVDLKNEWVNDDMSNVSGAVTFFAVLALFPFLLFLVSLASYFISPSSAASVVDSLSRVAPEAVTKIVGDRIRALSQSQNAGLLTISAVITLWSASGGMIGLMDGLNKVYGVQDSRGFLKQRGLAFLLTILTAVIALVAALGAVAIPPVASALGGPLGTILLWVRLPIAAALMMFLWAVLYWALPDVEQDFKFITPGSVVGVLLWVIASWGFSQYVSHFGNYEVTYGALGGIVILLFWMWISSMVVLLGAEINAVIEHRSPEGKKAGAKSFADAGESGTKTEEAEAHGPPPRVVYVKESGWKRALEVAAAGLAFKLFRKKA